MLRLIYDAVLGIPPGTSKQHSHFDSLGGHSLSAARLTACIKMIFSVKVSPITLLGMDTTLSDIADKIQAKWADDTPSGAQSPRRQPVDDPKSVLGIFVEMAFTILYVYHVTCKLNNRDSLVLPIPTMLYHFSVRCVRLTS